jgi:hypothetical protein
MARTPTIDELIQSIDGGQRSALLARPAVT